MPEVVLVQKLAHVPDGVTIQRLAATGREGHGDHPISHVSQVKVKVLVNVATLVLRHLKYSWDHEIMFIII